MFTSSVVKLPDGNEILFSDSGRVPRSSNYTTLIVLHGSAFTGHGFEKIHEFAPYHNLRTVVLQRKDYPGSTKYTDAELTDMAQGRKIFLDRLALLIAHFLKYFVEEHKIPKISNDGKNGGFALLGWSMGTATAMPIFSDPEIISKDDYALLQQYVKDLVLYDPPYLSFGYDLPADNTAYHPWTDPDCETPEALYTNFKTWVTSYYETPADWSGDINALDFRKRTSRTTIDSWTAQDHERNYNQEAAVRSELRMYDAPMQLTIRNLTQRVLFDEKLAQTFFPKVGVTYISGGSSNWHCIWGAHEARKLYEEHIARGEKIRPTRFITVRHGNHFIHEDYPEDFLKAVAAGIR